jgi:hypothetical protein
MLSHSPKQIWLDSKVYAVLLNKVGVNPYTLIAVYSKLLYHRNKESHYEPVKRSNNKTTTGYRMLTLTTCISLTALKKYVPVLIEEGLCRFTEDGGFHLNGHLKNEKIYKNQKRKKVLINLEGSLSQIKTSVKSVIIISNILKKQTRAIEHKIALSKAKKAKLKGYATLKQIKKLEKSKDDSNSVTRQTVLSNGGVKRILEYKSVSGRYWKQKMIKEGYILSRRRFKSLHSKTISYKEYCNSKPYFECPTTYKNGRICRELTPEVMVLKNNPNNIHYYNSDLIVNKYNLLKDGFPSSQLLLTEKNAC